MEFEDIELRAVGHEIVMVGALYQGKGQAFIAMFPEEAAAPGASIVAMDNDDWQKLLRQADLLEREVEVNEADGSVRKAILRKSQRQIDQGVSWAVFRRDGYACRYCGRNDVPLTVDHLVLWEERGPSTEENLVSACRKCNKVRGVMQYATWLQFPYYLQASRRLTETQRATNEALVATLDSIPRVHRQRSR